MPGMGTGLQTNNSTIVSAFQSALLHQGLFVLVILAALALAWNVLRATQLRRAMNAGEGSAPAAAPVWQPAEPVARRVLRIAFGLIWVLDGVLQGQAAMPLGMTSQVIQPTAAASPAWVQHLVNSGVTIWNYHPVTAAASAVWIQIGIGAWLLVAPRGNWSRLGGLASAGWGILVWIFGESFGGIFAPGLTWLFGAPGAALFYVLAGLLVALPERLWASPRLGRSILGVMGLFFVGMALLQAWPGRGFWQGHLAHSSSPGTLTSMVEQMATVRQPHVLSSWVASFAAFDAAHGWAVNLVVVIALAAIGVAFLVGRARIVRVAVIAGVVLCLADWVLIEDFGFFGGTGTDPNSMIPMALVFLAGYVAMTKVPVTAATIVALAVPPDPTLSWRARLAANPTYAFRGAAALGAIGVTLLGAAPMAVASTNPNADPIVAQAIDGTPNVMDVAAPSFDLTDQFGRHVSLTTFRGKTVVIAFLDPVCVSDCPLIAQELRQADTLLGARSRGVELLAVVINPVYRAPAYMVAFDHQEGLDRLANWHFLTGSLSELDHVWSAFGMQVAYSSGGSMIAHSDLAYVIDSTGRTRDVLSTDPGPGTAATKSSFSVTLASVVRSVER
ncbi:MAG: hypothetical protein JWO62_3595 [Acidimicrobiaceae bacterium]|nr:hypothetical protein [Acidimicrobiaceae bacterium]